MNRSLINLWIAIGIALASIVALATIAWTADTKSQENRTVEILKQQLQPYANDINALMNRYSIELERLTDISKFDDLPSTVSQLKRNPLVQQVIVVDRENHVVYPRSIDDKDAKEVNLLRDALETLQDRSSTSDRIKSQESKYDKQESVVQPKVTHWINWFHNRGLMLGFQWPTSSGDRAMIVLPRGRWQSDIVSILPSATSNSKRYDSQMHFELLDVGDSTVYQWGEVMSKSKTSLVTASVNLSSPLDAWQLRCSANRDSQQHLAGRNSTWQYIVSVVSVSVLLIGLGLVITFSLRSAINQAARRISFVNQVSHELKTPLTNVMLYSELLRRDVDQLDSSEQSAQLNSRMDTIQSEAKRLQHLIDNVLQFARNSRGEQRLHTDYVEPDHCVRESIERMTLRLSQAQIKISTALSSPQFMWLDSCAIQQILDNLLTNVEKYASSGKSVCIATCQTESLFKLTVVDHGPGIPAAMRDKVFQPFTRMDNSLTAVAGTGIGLSIVRDLARLHGGDCVVLSCQTGAAFEVTLRSLEAKLAEEIYVSTHC